MSNNAFTDAAFEPRVSGNRSLSGRLPNLELKRGTAMVTTGYGEKGERIFATADPSRGNGRIDGFLTRDVRIVDNGDRPATGGNPATSDELLYNFGMERPFTAGQMGAVEEIKRYEVEGEDHTWSYGTGALAANTAVGSKISFKEGKAYLAQEDDLVQYVVEAQLEPKQEANEYRLALVQVGGGYATA